MLADPEERKHRAEATRQACQRPETKAAQAASRDKKLPEELIIKLYKQDWLLSDISRKVGAGFRPNSGTPRLTRVRNVLKRAGVYPRKKSQAAKAGK